MSNRLRVRSLTQAAQRSHTRHGKHYDPHANDKTSNALVIVAFIVGVIVLGGAVGGFLYAQHLKAEEERLEAEKPLKSRALLEEMLRYRQAHSSDAEIDSVRIYVEQRKGQLMEAEKFRAEEILVSLKEQKIQADYRKRLDEKLNFVRANASNPDYVDQVMAAAEGLEKLLMDMDDTRAEDVKREIFTARGKSAIAAARQRLQKADKLATEKYNDHSALMAAYEKADEILAESAVAQKFPETKEIRDEVAIKTNAIAERWAESPLGFTSLQPRNLLDGKEFETQKGEEKPHWQVSPTAKLSWNGMKLVVEGVKPDRNEFKDERAGIAFWAPSSKFPIRHYELRMRVKLLTRGFTLVARQGSGYARHTYDFEDVPATEKRDPDGYYPKEGETYDIVQRVYGKKIHIQITPTNPNTDEPLPAPIEATTATIEGGVGLQVRVGAKIEVERMEIRILR